MVGWPTTRAGLTPDLRPPCTWCLSPNLLIDIMALKLPVTLQRSLLNDRVSWLTLCIGCVAVEERQQGPQPNGSDLHSGHDKGEQSKDSYSCVTSYTVRYVWLSFLPVTRPPSPCLSHLRLAMGPVILYGRTPLPSSFQIHANRTLTFK